MSSRWAPLEGLLQVLFPPLCTACLKPGRSPFCRLCEDAVGAPGFFEVSGCEVAEAAAAYGGPVALAIQRLKYHKAPWVARALGPLLLDAYHLIPEVDAWVPVPLPPSRLVSRGFNQVRELGRSLPLPVELFALKRWEQGEVQAGLGREARAANLEDAFWAAPARVNGKRLLLVDDVVTTGSTAVAATQALIDAGAHQVHFLALARTKLQAH